VKPEEMVERLISFAARVGKVVDALPDTRMGRHIASQFIRSATSPAANYEEACAAESRADFIHKLAICLKELRESRCWIRMIIKTEIMPDHRMNDLLDECDQLCKIVGQSIVTAKQTGSKKRNQQTGTKREPADRYRNMKFDIYTPGLILSPHNLQFAICNFQFAIPFLLRGTTLAPWSADYVNRHAS